MAFPIFQRAKWFSVRIYNKKHKEFAYCRQNLPVLCLLCLNIDSMWNSSLVYAWMCVFVCGGGDRAHCCILVHTMQNGDITWLQNNEVLLNCVAKYAPAYISSPSIVFSAPMGRLVSLVVWHDLLFLPSLYIKALLFFLFDLADSSLRMWSIDLLSDLSWSALNSRLIDSCCIPRDRTN